MIKRWHSVAYLREVLRENKSLDASQLAVHLDQVRLGLAPAAHMESKRLLVDEMGPRGPASLAAGILVRKKGLDF